jgi:hypothetical protein
VKTITEGSWKRRRVAAVTAAAAVTLGVGIFAATPASAAPADANTAAAPQIPKNAQVVSVSVVKGTPQRVSAQQELARAQQAGAPASALAQIAVLPNAYSCWYWDTQVYYKNALGQVILRFHVEPNWCTTGYWLASPVYTNTWANVNVPGWSYTHTGGWTKYGAGWNIYITHQNGHFCFVSYFGCVQNKYPWIEDEVGPGSATDYFHYAT